MTSNEGPEITPEQEAQVASQRLTDIVKVDLAIIEATRCWAGLAGLEELPPTSNERDFAQHVLGHTMPAIQWAMMRDTARLIDFALLARLEATKMPKPEDLTGWTDDQWFSTQSIVTTTTVTLLEGLANEFRLLAEAALEDSE